MEFYQNVIKIVTAPTVVITIIENEEPNEVIIIVQRILKIYVTFDIHIYVLR